MTETQPIAVRDRLIVPLDVPDFAQAQTLVETLGDAVSFYKVGLELLLSGGGFRGEFAGMMDWLVSRDKKVMVDLKLFDIGRTVAAAVGQLAGRGATFVTVHGNDEILRAAVEAAGTVQVLAVTVLTSLDQKDMEDLGFQTDIGKLVLSRARRAVALGCAGVVASGLEVGKLRQEIGARFLAVIPGVRPGLNKEVDTGTTYQDDQKRIVTIDEAFAGGADYVVVGRPIRSAADPRAAAEDIQGRIARRFAG
ncbi:MAG TPA: orotidine-5'-phosphate decarboxylase [Thermoanaerobaculia bacterium]